jgi:hypothetical protein
MGHFFEKRARDELLAIDAQLRGNPYPAPFLFRPALA